MNQFTRRLVNATLAISVTSLCALADPISVRSGHETVTPDHRTLRTTETVQFGGEVTQSSFSSGERLDVKNTFSTARNNDSGYDSSTKDQVAFLNPSNGKVATSTSTEVHHEGQPTVVADIN